MRAIYFMTNLLCEEDARTKKKSQGVGIRGGEEEGGGANAGTSATYCE